MVALGPAGGAGPVNEDQAAEMVAEIGVRWRELAGELADAFRAVATALRELAEALRELITFTADASRERVVWNRLRARTTPVSPWRLMRPRTYRLG